MFLYLAVRKVDLAESVRLLIATQFGWLAAATLVYLSAFPIRALRWRRILYDQKALSLREVLVPVSVGHMANNVLPARAGEIYRAHFLGRRAQMSRSGVMGSIVVERAFDILMLICLMLLLFFFLPETHFLGGTVLTTGVIFFALVAGIFAYRFRVDETHRVIDKVLRVLPQRLEKFVARQFKSFLQGIRGVSTVGGCLEVIVCTVLIWALETSSLALVVISLGVTLPLSGYLLLQALAALSTALPSGPAYIGPYQYAFVIALGFFAISTETALAISVTTQVALLGSITVIGLVLLWREQLRAGPLARRKKLEARGGKVG